MNIPHLYSIAFALVIAMVVYDELKNCHDLPFPPRLIYVGLVFGLLDLTSLVLPTLTGVMAIGMVLAMLLCTIENHIGKVSAPCGLALTGCSATRNNCQGSAQPAAFTDYTQSTNAPNLPPGMSVTGPSTPV